MIEIVMSENACLRIVLDAGHVQLEWVGRLRYASRLVYWPGTSITGGCMFWRLRPRSTHITLCFTTAETRHLVLLVYRWWTCQSLMVALSVSMLRMSDFQWALDLVGGMRACSNLGSGGWSYLKTCRSMTLLRLPWRQWNHRIQLLAFHATNFTWNYSGEAFWALDRWLYSIVSLRFSGGWKTSHLPTIQCSL